MHVNDKPHKLFESHVTLGCDGNEVAIYFTRVCLSFTKKKLVCLFSLGRFRVTFCLCFNTSLRAKPFI